MVLRHHQRRIQKPCAIEAMDLSLFWPRSVREQIKNDDLGVFVVGLFPWNQATEPGPGDQESGTGTRAKAQEPGT